MSAAATRAGRRRGCAAQRVLPARAMNAVARLIMAAAACAITAASVPAAGPVPAVQAASASGSAILAPGWARVVAAGTLAAIVPASGILTVAFTGPSHADVYEGGTSWHSRPLSGTRLIHVLPQTVMVDNAARPIASARPRSGDHLAVWGVMAPDDEIMALSVVVTTARAAPPQADVSAPGHVHGVVAARSGATLDLLSDTGVRHAVILTGSTQVRSPVSASAAVLAPFDVLQIDGAVNSDGSLVATRVNVEFLSSQGAQVSGPIESVLGGVDGFVVGETMVCASTQTYFLSGVSRLWISQMSAGRPVTVYGVPIIAGRTPVGLAARVVAVR